MKLERRHVLCQRLRDCNAAGTPCSGLHQDGAQPASASRWYGARDLQSRRSRSRSFQKDILAAASCYKPNYSQWWAGAGGFFSTKGRRENGLVFNQTKTYLNGTLEVITLQKIFQKLIGITDLFWKISWANHTDKVKGQQTETERADINRDKERERERTREIEREIEIER